MPAEPPCLDPSGTPLIPGRRAAPRLRLAIPARFVSLCAIHECIVLDVSCTGARVALVDPLAVGQSGYLTIAQMEVFGTILRRECNERGEGIPVNAMTFDEPISREAVLRIRSFADSFEQRRTQALRDQVRRWVTGES